MNASSFLPCFAIAYEIEATEQYSDNLMRVQLAVGLPPAHFGVQAKRFTVYFEGRGAISFQFHGKAYAILLRVPLASHSLFQLLPLL